jgi:hypothetical protein
VRTRILALCAAGLLAAPAAALAQPNAVRVQSTVQPGATLTLTIGKVPRGEFAFRLRAGSDSVKRFTLTQQRNGGKRFTVLRVPGPLASGCQGAAGSIICEKLTSPAAPGGRTWTFRLRNGSDRPLSVDLRVAWHRLRSAG